MIKLGTGNVTLYLGDKKVKAAWLGSEKVYPNSFLELSASSLSFAAAGQTQQLAITVNDGQAWTIAALPAGFSVSASSGTGPATVTITAANNTSTTARTGALTVNSEDLSAACSLSQTAGAKVYGAWQNVSWSIDTTSFTAAGGRSNAVMNVARTWTWNGVAGSGGTETSTSSLRNATSSPAGISISSENWIQAPSLGTTFKAQTTYTLSSASAVASNQVSATVVQAANSVVKVDVIGSRVMSYAAAPAGGGTITPTFTVPDMNNVMRVTMASGQTAGWSHADTGGNWSITSEKNVWNGPSGNFTALNASTGAVTVSSKGTAVSGVTNGPVVTRQIYYRFSNDAAYGGEVVDANTYCPMTGTPTQAANAVTGYGTPTGRTLSVADIPASGGSVSSGTLGGTITQSRTFTSGDSDTLTNPTVSASSYSAAVSGANLGTTVTSRTAKGTLTHYYTCNGKQGSCSATVYQAANTWYDHDIVLSASSTSIGAAGGSVTLTSTVYRMYASGTRAVGGSGYGTLSGSATGFTVSGWTVTAAGRGTTVGAARSISVTSKYAGLVSNVVTITQEANQALSITYGTPSVTITSVADIPASGGTRNTGSCTYSQARTQNYTSGDTSALSALTSGGSVSWSTVTASSLTTTVKPRTSVGTITCTVTMNGKTGSASATVYQAANYLTGLTVTPSAFSYSVAPAAAGNSTPSNSGSDTQTFTFASGATGTSGSISGTYYTVSTSLKYSWSAAAGFFSSLNTASGVVATTTAGTTAIASQLAGPLVTKTLTVTYTPTSALGAGTTITKSGTATAYPQKGTNTKSASSSSCISGTTTLRTYYKWTSGADGGYSDNTKSYDCGYRAKAQAGLTLIQSGVMVSPVIGAMTVHAIAGPSVQYMMSAAEASPSVSPRFGNNTMSLELTKADMSTFSPITYLIYQCLVSYTDSGGTGASPMYSWSADSGCSIVSQSGSLCIVKITSPGDNVSCSVSCTTMAGDHSGGSAA